MYAAYNATFMENFCNSTHANEDEDIIVALCMVSNGMNELAAGVNIFFLLYAGSLVLFMQAGFAMLCAGLIRQKNVKNIMLKNLLDACGGALGFWTTGYAFAYGGHNATDNLTLIDHSNFFLRDATTGDEYITFFFQLAFAAAASSIVAGAVAERCKMAAYLFYSVFLTGFVYPVVVHSVWDVDGFFSHLRRDPLFDVGAVDFAGGGVVHMTGGVTSLVAIIILGPRIGRFYDRDGNPLDKPVHFPAHSTSLAILGVFLLWFGWYGFNPGSALSPNTTDQASVAALCAVTTTLAAAAGCATALFTDTIITTIETGETNYDVIMGINGALSGLVAITAGCAVVTPWASVVIGMTSGWVYRFANHLLLRLRIDDAVDAVPVHMANGAWGLIAVGLFAEESRMGIAGYNSEHPGLFYSWAEGNWDAGLLANQLLCVLWITAWVSAIMGPYFYALRIAGLFRVGALEEEVGMDISHHLGAAYHLSGPADDVVEELMEARAMRRAASISSHLSNSEPEGEEEMPPTIDSDEGNNLTTPLVRKGS